MATQSASEPTDDQAAAAVPESGAATSAEQTPEVAVDAGQSAESTTAHTTEPTIEPTAEPVTSVTESVPAAAPASPTVVFVQAPQPPKKRGARGVGALVALLGAGLFAAAYALLVLLIGIIEPRYGVTGAIETIGSVIYWVPVLVFFLAYLLLIVIVNRAGWWAHVLGGFIVAVLVWVGFVGAAIIAAGAFGAPASQVGAVVLQQLTNPLGFAAAIAAREVPIWVGGLVAKRGRTARARNAANRAAYEQELAEHRATIGANTAV